MNRYIPDEGSAQVITREKFHQLLLVYMGAMHHLEYVASLNGSNSEVYRLARDAAVKALNDFETAVGV